MSTPAPPGPTLGPCTAWIGADELAACCDGLADADPAALETFAVEACMALFEVSGRQFTGLCERTVRPSAQPCSCFGGSTAAGFDWRWASSVYGSLGLGQWWANECGDRMGCGSVSSVKLAGYPVRQITQVKIDGAVIDPAGYRLDGWRHLVRLDDPGPPVVTNRWPACQNMSLAGDQPGTFEVSYLHGVDPPQLGRDAACQLGCQLFLSCNGATCQLPAGVTKVVRQGVEIDRELLASWLDPKKGTGLVLVDTFLAAYGGKMRQSRRPAIHSPDVQRFARRVGS